MCRAYTNLAPSGSRRTTALLFISSLPASRNAAAMASATRAPTPGSETTATAVGPAPLMVQPYAPAALAASLTAASPGMRGARTGSMTQSLSRALPSNRALPVGRGGARRSGRPGGRVALRAHSAKCKLRRCPVTCPSCCYTAVAAAPELTLQDRGNQRAALRAIVDEALEGHVPGEHCTHLLGGGLEERVDQHKVKRGCAAKWQADQLQRVTAPGGGGRARVGRAEALVCDALAYRTMGLGGRACAGQAEEQLHRGAAMNAGRQPRHFACARRVNKCGVLLLPT